MKLADRMSRIGTESAFEVLAKARALEKQGKNVIHLEIGEPDFPTPAHVVEAGTESAGERAGRSTGRHLDFPSCARPSPRYVSTTRGISGRPGQRLRRAGRQADHVLRHDGAAQPRRRGDLPRPELPDLRVDDQFSRREGRPGAARRESRLLVRSRDASSGACRRAPRWSSSTRRRTRPAA